MPSLKQLQCNIELTDAAKTQLPEYNTSYADGVVNTFVAVPSKASGFCIKLRSHGYIASGLGAFVFIDGIYQCNRVRRGLVPRVDGASTPRTEVSFTFRQQETPKDGKFEVRDWRFEKLNIAAADDESNSPPTAESAGTIAVAVLRCKPDTEPGYVPRDPSKSTTRGSTPKQTSAKKAPTVASIREEDERSTGGLGGLFDGAFDVYHPTVYDSDPSNTCLYDEIGRRRYSYGSGSYQNESFYLDARAFLYYSPPSAHRHSGRDRNPEQGVIRDVSRENLEIFLASLSAPPTSDDARGCTRDLTGFPDYSSRSSGSTRRSRDKPPDDPFDRTFPTERSPGVSRSEWGIQTRDPPENTNEDPFLSAGEYGSAWPDHTENRHRSRAGFDGNNSGSNSAHQGWEPDHRPSGGSDTSRRSVTFEPTGDWSEDPFAPLIRSEDANIDPLRIGKVKAMVFEPSSGIRHSTSVETDPFLSSGYEKNDSWGMGKVEPMVFETNAGSKPSASMETDPFTGNVFDNDRASRSSNRPRPHRSRHTSPSPLQFLLELTRTPDPPQVRDWATHPATPSPADIPLPASRTVSYASTPHSLAGTVIHSPYPDPFTAPAAHNRHDSLDSLKPPSHLSNNTYHSHSHRSGSLCTNASCNAYISMTGPALSGAGSIPHAYHGLGDDSAPPPETNQPLSKSPSQDPPSARRRVDRQKQKDHDSWGGGDTQQQPAAASWGVQDNDAGHGWGTASQVSAGSWPDLGGSAVNAWGPRPQTARNDKERDAEDPWAEFQGDPKPSSKKDGQQGGNASRHSRQGSNTSYRSARSHLSAEKEEEKENARHGAPNKTPSQSSKTGAHNTPPGKNRNTQRPVSPAAKTWPGHTGGPDIHGWSDTIAADAQSQVPVDEPWGGVQNDNGPWSGSQNLDAANDQAAPGGDPFAQGDATANSKNNNNGTEPSNNRAGSNKGSNKGSQKGSVKGSQKGSVKGSNKGKNNNVIAGPSQPQQQPKQQDSSCNSNANANADMNTINNNTPGGWPMDPPSRQQGNQQQQKQQQPTQQQPQSQNQNQPQSSSQEQNQDQSQPPPPWGPDETQPAWDNTPNQEWNDTQNNQDQNQDQTPPSWNGDQTQNQSQQQPAWNQGQNPPNPPRNPPPIPSPDPCQPSGDHRPSNTSRRRAERLHPYTTPPIPATYFPHPSWFATVPASAAFPPPATPFPAPITAAQAAQHSLDARVGAGPVATYHHRTARPEYVDSLGAPYAVFTFQYRSRKMLEQMLGVRIGETEEDVREKLLGMDKEEIVRELLRLRSAGGIQDSVSENGTVRSNAGAGGQFAQQSMNDNQNDWSGAQTGDQFDQQPMDNGQNDWSNAQPGGDPSNWNNEPSGGGQTNWANVPSGGNQGNPAAVGGFSNNSAPQDSNFSAQINNAPQDKSLNNQNTNAPQDANTFDQTQNQTDANNTAGDVQNVSNWTDNDKNNENDNNAGASGWKPDETNAGGQSTWETTDPAAQNNDFTPMPENGEPVGEWNEPVADGAWKADETAGVSGDWQPVETPAGDEAPAPSGGW